MTFDPTAGLVAAISTHITPRIACANPICGRPSMMPASEYCSACEAAERSRRAVLAAPGLNPPHTAYRPITAAECYDLAVKSWVPAAASEALVRAARTIEAMEQK